MIGIVCKSRALISKGHFSIRGEGTKDVGGIICPLVEIGLNYLPNMHGLAVFIKEHS